MTFIENKAVVIGFLDKSLGEKTGLKIGDEIEMIDKKSVENIVKEKLPLTLVSNYPQLPDIARNLLRTNKNSLDISYSNDSKKITTQIQTFDPGEAGLYVKFQKRDTCFKIINSDIAYLYPGSVKNEEFFQLYVKHATHLTPEEATRMFSDNEITISGSPIVIVE